MCDYSLMAIPNRLAVSGEELIVHRFEAGSVGLASALDLRRIQECRKAHFRGFWSTIKAFFVSSDTRSISAVCIPPGARLLIRDIPAKLQQECGFQDGVKEAVFTQVTAVVNTFRDAVRFHNGVEVLLQRFDEGQRVRVLDLSFAEEQATGSTRLKNQIPCYGKNRADDLAGEWKLSRDSVPAVPAGWPISHFHEL